MPTLPSQEYITFYIYKKENSILNCNDIFVIIIIFNKITFITEYLSKHKKKILLTPDFWTVVCVYNKAF